MRANIYGLLISKDGEVKMNSLSKLFSRSSHASGTFINKALIVAICVGWAAGCSKSTDSSAPLIIDSIHFEEMNGEVPINASGIVSLADSRFLICDNNTDDALLELDLGPDGRKKGPLIRRPLQGLSPGAIDDMEGMALVEENGRR